MKTAYYIGMMSGTSLDGVDAALADFNRSPPSLLGTFYLPYSPDLRGRLLELHQAGVDELHRAAMLGNELSRHYADAVGGLLRDSGVSRGEVRAIGCHGQTVRHCPQAERAYTIQLFNPALLAELTGVTVVADFRSRDIAAGGQGAPLVPAFHSALFMHSECHRIIVNIGGICNLTSLARGQVAGYDCGPGNMLMDAWCSHHTGEPYDENGNWARSGEVIESLLERFLALPFFSLPPPKSAGREQFNFTWLESCLNGNEKPEDVQATLLELTVQSISRSVFQYFPRAAELYLCGGGARNGAVITRLGLTMPGKTIELTDRLGVSADWVEAFAFAWLAKQAISGVPANLPVVTGARDSRILGAIYQA
ncbi:MAG TPA: anhydro-N-acetylmuramic acid kinase [Nitrosospira sp.]|nr:anhydro-N-acetylmuramic acid kinase [Nitrosospira sp.]